MLQNIKLFHPYSSRKVVSSTEETPAQRPQSLARLLTYATSNLTKLQADIKRRDRDLSQKLDAMKNGALEDLKVEKKIDEIISDMSKLWQQQKKTQMLLESLSNQTSAAAAAAATAADKPTSTVKNSAAKFTKQVLDRRLLLLGKSYNSLLFPQYNPTLHCTLHQWLSMCNWAFNYNLPW